MMMNCHVLQRIVNAWIYLLLVLSCYTLCSLVLAASSEGFSMLLIIEEECYRRCSNILQTDLHLVRTRLFTSLN